MACNCDAVLIGPVAALGYFRVAAVRESAYEASLVVEDGLDGR